ncbi:MAG: septum site-determining protein MinC, partial [Thiothrix sp.]
CAHSPQLFANSPVVIDGSRLGDACLELDMLRLHTIISDLGLIPVGIRNIPESCHAAAINAGWAVLRTPRTATPVRQERPAERDPEGPQPCIGTSLRVIERPLRSGQQVYFPEGSVVILQHTSAGSEILAGGSVHIYGSLRGRVLAGIGGDTNARIFCQKLEDQQVAIAGNYRLLDDIDTNLKGQPAMVWLEGEKLRIAPMF